MTNANTFTGNLQRNGDGYIVLKNPNAVQNASLQSYGQSIVPNPLAPFLVFDGSAGTTFNMGGFYAPYPNTLYLRNNDGQPVNLRSVEQLPLETAYRTCS